MTGIYQDNSETIGNTPLVKINRITPVSYTHLTLPTSDLV